MTPTDKSAEVDVDQVSSKLFQGLQSCRAVIDDYRGALVATPTAAGEQVTTPDRPDPTKEAATRQR